MHPSITPIAQIFGVSTVLYDWALAGLGRKTLLMRPRAASNPLLGSLGTWPPGDMA